MLWQDCKAKLFCLVYPITFPLTKSHRFTRTITHHPDKITDASARPAAEAIYVHLKLARDTLVDPAKRFAYDRFGPDILHWRSCTTIADFVKAGVQNTLMYYAGTGAVLVVLGLVGYLKQAVFVSSALPEPTFTKTPVSSVIKTPY